MVVNVGWRVNDLGKVVLTDGVIEFLRPNLPVCPGADLSHPG